MKKWECVVCGFIYDESKGWPEDARHPLGRRSGGLGMPGLWCVQSRFRNGWNM